MATTEKSMSNSLDDGAQFAGSDTSLPPGPFSASSRGTFGRLQAPRHGVANTNAALKSDADRNRGGGEKNEKSRQKTSSRRKSKIKKSNRRGRRQKTSESNPLRVAGVRAGGTTTEAQVTEEPKLRPCNVCKSSKEHAKGTLFGSRTPASPLGPFSASSRGTFGRIRAPRQI